MGLMNALGQGLSAAGYGAGEMFAKGALMDAQNEAETQKALRLEELKGKIKAGALAAKVAGQQAILNGGTPMGGSVATEGENGEPGAMAVDQARIAQVSKQYGISEDAIRFDMAYNSGKGVAKMIEERSKPDMIVQNGVAMDRNRLRPGVVPGVHTSASGDTIFTEPGEDGRPRVSVPPGAAEAVGELTGARERAKAANTVRQVHNPDAGQPEFTTDAEIIERARRAAGQRPAATASPESGLRAQTTGGMGGDPAAARREIEATRAVLNDPNPKRLPDPASRKLLEGHIADMERQLGNMGGPGAAPATPPGGRLAAGPSETEKAGAAALGESNKSWQKNADAVMEAGKVADDTLATITMARDAMKRLGSTGWTTETKAKAAGVLAGIGVTGGRIQEYAASAETFQAAAMERLWATLNAAKGPQTEGDADRAKLTFAQLKNTPQANEYILNLAQARAERDRLKATFYEQAAPVARKGGDMGVVDREWRSRAPSIFAMPSMQQYAKK